MLPRLEAEESQLASVRVAIGARATREDAAPVVRAWERAAARPTPAAQPSKQKAAAMPSELAGMGIGYRVQRSRPADG